MKNIEAYEERIVIFMDILGFKDTVSASSSDSKKFEQIKSTLIHIFEEKVKTDDSNNRFNDYSHQLSVFSDSLIYSAPISDDDTSFYTLLMVEYMQRELLELGFLTRGGIAVGPMVHNQEIAFGPALVEAVELEQSAAIYPRVIMTDKSYQKIDNRLKQKGVYAYPSEKQSFDNLLVHYKNELKEDFYFLDFLSQSEEYDYIEDYYLLLKKAKNSVEKNINTYIDEKHIRDKYAWFNNYLLEVCQKKGVPYTSL